MRSKCRSRRWEPQNRNQADHGKRHANRFGAESPPLYFVIGRRCRAALHSAAQRVGKDEVRLEVAARAGPARQVHLIQLRADGTKPITRRHLQPCHRAQALHAGRMPRTVSSGGVRQNM